MQHIREFQNGVRAYVFDTLNDDRVRSMMTTRIGGVSTGFYGSMTMGLSTGDSREHVLENCRRLAECMGCRVTDMVTGAQTHTKNIRIVTREDAGKGVTRDRDYDNVDGLITNERGLCLFTGHADCNPVLLYDPVEQVIGAIHSGWMGTLLNISREAVLIMKEHFNARPENIRAAIGPALCRDCFEVDPDVAERFLAAYPYLKTGLKTDGDYGKTTAATGKYHAVGMIPAADADPARAGGTLIRFDADRNKYYIDLKGIIATELKSLGLQEEHMEISGLCTKELPDLFFSHRRTGVRRGVMAASIMLTPGKK